MSQNTGLLRLGPPEFIPQTQMMLPHNYDGISIFRGLEADIIDFEGKLDVRDSYLEMLEFCIASMHHEVRICVSSDAHCHTLLGSFGPALELLDEICFPSELIVNYSLERFQSYIDERK
ncbi:MAG: PHP domain-containing protein, partial [Clostridia bacterium]